MNLDLSLLAEWALYLLVLVAAECVGHTMTLPGQRLIHAIFPLAGGFATPKLTQARSLARCPERIDTPSRPIIGIINVLVHDVALSMIELTCIAARQSV